MSLSIIIPALNEAEQIAATLDSLQPLRRRGVEVIVADGGSSDATVTLAQNTADRVITADRGRARQMNAGAAVAQGEILCFLHADTRLPENADGLIIDGLARARRSWGRFDVDIAGRHPMLKVIATLMNWRSRLTSIATGDQALFITRSLFEAAGRFPDIPLMEDIALSRQLKIYSRPLCIAHRLTTSGRRWEQQGLWRTVLLMWRLRLAYWLGADPSELAARYVRHNPDTAILVFARAPVAGATKTRLIPLLGAEGAAALHRRLLLHALATAGAALPGRVELWCSPDDSNPFLQAAASHHGARLMVQQGADLGARMAHAFAQALQQSRCVIGIGADCPALTAQHLRAAADALREGHDAVFAPAEDGGYTLVGLALEAPQIFAGIAWGGPDVMSATRTRLRDSGLRWQELATLWDVDRPEDYHRLLQSGLLDALPDAA